MEKNAIAVETFRRQFMDLAVRHQGDDDLKHIDIFIYTNLKISPDLIELWKDCCQLVKRELFSHNIGKGIFFRCPAWVKPMMPISINGNKAIDASGNVFRRENRGTFVFSHTRQRSE